VLHDREPGVYSMIDLLFVIVTVGFFAIGVVYTYVCERL
jgi:hypothetical protein